jgi:quinol monooxygenase YgiN
MDVAGGFVFICKSSGWDDAGSQYLLEFRNFGNMKEKIGCSGKCRIAARAEGGLNGMGHMLFAIMVDFRLKQGTGPEFRRLIDANADASVKTEPGCLQFDVLEPEGEDDRVLLYEIYSDKAAFEAHLRTEHFRIFAGASEALCLEKKVIRCGLVFSGADVAAKRSGI